MPRGGARPLRLATEPARPRPFLPLPAPGEAGAAAGRAGLNRGAPLPARSAMDFSELFKLSGLLGRFSPDGKCLVSGDRRPRGVPEESGAAPARRGLRGPLGPGGAPGNSRSRRGDRWGRPGACVQRREPLNSAPGRAPPNRAGPPRTGQGPPEPGSPWARRAPEREAEGAAIALWFLQTRNGVYWTACLLNGS